MHAAGGKGGARVMRRPGDSAKQLTLDWTLPLELQGGAGGCGRFGFDCSALRFAAMEIVRLRARAAVNAAVKAGTLRKPERCDHCLGAGRLTGHHEEYSRPLAVRWLCDSCHRSETRRIAALARASLPNLVHTPGFKGTPSWIVRAMRKGEAKGAVTDKHRLLVRKGRGSG